LPTALLPVVARARYKGTLGAKGTLAFDTRDLDALILSYQFDDRCKLEIVPEELDKDHFAHAFRYWAVDKDAKPIELETGPGTERWTPLDEISPYMQVAVLTTEDGLFYKHKGFNHAAIKQSLIANLKAHKFVRGASTITMQLAKNLFLSREKTLARKLQEIVIAVALEQELSKDDMMELYLNVIEFGPDIYGIGAAADHYFGRTPGELNLSECLFLSSLLPKPRDSHKIYEKGDVPPSWMSNIHSLMQIAAKMNRITPKELEDGQSEKIVFYKYGDRPPARQPVRGPRVVKDGHVEDGDWVPLQ
jgi:membrane peptidoglycan carboxypeptidase